MDETPKLGETAEDLPDPIPMFRDDLVVSGGTTVDSRAEVEAANEVEDSDEKLKRKEKE